MKHKHQDFVLIKGGSAPKVQGSVEPARADPSQAPSNASLTPSASTAAMDRSAHILWAAVRSELPPSTDPSFQGANLDGLRDFDSLRLSGHAGVVRVGVNDLGWVVYDWFPGP